jgi:hypothetical protein
LISSHLVQNSINFKFTKQRACLDKPKLEVYPAMLRSLFPVYYFSLIPTFFGFVMLHWHLCPCCNGIVTLVALASWPSFLLLVGWCRQHCCAGIFVIFVQVLLPLLQYDCCCCCPVSSPSSSGFTNDEVEKHALLWTRNVEIGYCLCPFVDHPLQERILCLSIVRNENNEKVALAVIHELVSRLDDSNPGTTVVIVPEYHPDDFERYILLVQYTKEDVMDKLDLTGKVQLAPFHPRFRNVNLLGRMEGWYDREGKARAMEGGWGEGRAPPEGMDKYLREVRSDQLMSAVCNGD